MNPICKFKQMQKDLATKIKADHIDWDSVTFRHQHIAYCELRGRDRKQIEQPREDNLPNETWIDKIKRNCELSIGCVSFKRKITINHHVNGESISSEYISYKKFYTFIHYLSKLF